MRVFRYWARGKIDARPQRACDIPIWAGSDSSQQDADRAARAAAEQRAQRLRDGERLETYPYPCRTMPEPIEQEWFDDAGRRIAAITVNRAACRVLNTARVPFVDVDLDELKLPSDSGSGWKLRRKRPTAQERIEAKHAVAMDRLAAYAHRHPRFAARVYQTAAGLRYLVTSPTMDPASRETADMLAYLCADPKYALLCKAQESFRARLTPKPWRTRAGAPPGRMDVEGEWKSSPTFTRWLDDYHAASREHAVCAHLLDVGSAAPEPDAARIIEAHDHETRVGSALELA